jgi:DeoR/GlpR family transcriptional regulator of sugar metabolism
MARGRANPVDLEARRQRVLTRVVECGEVRIDQLAEEFDVSLMTMHRDVDELAQRALLRKLRGRVAPMPPVTQEMPTEVRSHAQLKEKEAIAALALDELVPNTTILMDDSTTLFPLARRLSEEGRFTVVTNSLGITQILGPDHNVQVHLLGGKYNRDFNSTTGPEVDRSLRRFHADTALMSATAVSGGVLYHPIQEYAAVKEAMLSSAKRRVLLVDHTKFGRRSTFAYGDVSTYELVITDCETPGHEIKAMRDLGVEVLVVDSSGHNHNHRHGTEPPHPA